MEQIIETFHLDIKLLIAQFINFIVVFGILYALAVKPLTKLMAERSQKIEDGLKNAEEFDQKLLELDKKEEDVLNIARKEAQQIVQEAREQAELQRQVSLDKTKEDVQSLITKARIEVADIKDKMVSDIKKESLDFVVAVSEKVLGDVVDKKVDRKLIEGHLKKVTK